MRHPFSFGRLICVFVNSCFMSVTYFDETETVYSSHDFSFEVVRYSSVCLWSLSSL